jgi:hypothetical protein
MPTYGGTPVLTKAQANACHKIVKKLLGEDGNDAALYPPGHEGPMWVVSFEGYEDDTPWPIRLAAIDGAFPDGVFAEPVTSWCLGLYPAYCRYCAEGADDQPCPYHPA